MWIKTSDKLPQENIEVLCLWSWAGKNGCGCGMHVCYLLEGEWIGSADYAGNVTHWMPLPAPPTADIAEGANLQPPTPQGVNAQSSASTVAEPLPAIAR